MKLSIYNQQGEEIRMEDFDVKGIDTLKTSADLVHQVVVASLANKRHAIAHTKQRGEVSGGGIKPWKQKGTGRARHGSIRSPLWVGGGIVFGPRSNRNFSKVIPAKMYRKALAMALSEKLRGEQIYVVESFDMTEVKTKHVASLLQNLPFGKKEKTGYTIVLLNASNGTMRKAIRNMKGVDAIRDADLDVVSVLKSKQIVTTPDSLKTIINRCAVKKVNA